MISLDCNSQCFKLKAIAGTTNFHSDRDKAKKLPGRRPIWGIDQATKRNVFQYWEVPKSSLSNILSLWQTEEILATDPVKAVISSFSEVRRLPAELPTIECENFDWGPIEPKPYQKKYVLINASKRKLICSFWLGMGKTYGALWRAKILGFNRLLIVCPANANLRNKWIKSVRLLFGSDVQTLNYEGTPAKRKRLISEKLLSAKVVLVSHSLAKELADLSNLAEQVGAEITIFDQIVIDEAHLLCNRTTKLFKSVCRLVTSNARSGLQLVTATPINHKIQDLWALVFLIDPAVAGDKDEWDKRYIKVLKSFPKKMRWGGIKHIPIRTEPQNLYELRERIAPFLIRTEPDEYVTFTDTTEIIPISLSERQKELYKQVREEVLQSISDEDAKGPEALTKTMKVIRVCEGAYHVNPDWEDSSKMDYVIKELEAARETGEKILVWSISVDTIKRLHAKFADSVMFNGTLSDMQKNMAVWSFHGVEDDEEREAFNDYKQKYKWPFDPAGAQFFFGVIHPKSSNGIDLHVAARQIFMSFHWNGNANIQAKGRLVRIGQKASEVKTEFLVAEKTFEKSALLLILSNYQVTLDIISGRSSGQYKNVTEWISYLRKYA